MPKPIKHQPVLDRRRFGVLLHPTSLPGAQLNGDFGPDAYHFIDFLIDCGATVWQMLPLVPTHEDKSPYMGLSVLAGNPVLISMQLLVDWGWLPQEKLSAVDTLSPEQKTQLVNYTYQLFQQRLVNEELNEFNDFIAQHIEWISEYALFQVLRRHSGQQSWTQWDSALRDREPIAIENAKTTYHHEINEVIFEQFVFFKQWKLIKQYANERGVLIFGDMPIFVAHDSAEVWACREQFKLYPDGSPKTVAGVPPDYFSATGQRWGNPHYNWKQMRESHFEWWIQRLRCSLELFDFIRVDHFRGFEAHWEIKASEDTAMNGKWVKTPGRALFNALLKEFKTLPFVAEDLGVITDEVNELRENYGWPGMKILQFAFDSNSDNPYLPHNFSENSVVYTGTHDNDTTVSWYQQLDDIAKQHIKEYLGDNNDGMPWALIHCALSSVARLAMIPMQDLMALDHSGRMNTPGVQGDNWGWRFNWQDIDPNLANRLVVLNKKYSRCIYQDKSKAG